MENLTEQCIFEARDRSDGSVFDRNKLGLITEQDGADSSNKNLIHIRSRGPPAELLLMPRLFGRL
jgi:hypothetical protein